MRTDVYTTFIHLVEGLKAGSQVDMEIVRDAVRLDGYKSVSQYLASHLDALEELGLSHLSRQGRQVFQHPTLGMLQWAIFNSYRGKGHPDFLEFLLDGQPLLKVGNGLDYPPRIPRWTVKKVPSPLPEELLALFGNFSPK